MEGREKDYCNANEEIHLDEAVKEEMRQKLAAACPMVSDSASEKVRTGRRKSRPGRRSTVAPRGLAVCCVAVLAVVLAALGARGKMPWIPNGSEWLDLAKLDGSMTVQAAEYPAGSDFEEFRQQWRDTLEEYGYYSHELLRGIKLFARDSAGLVLGQETDANLCYSPVSLYTALAMVAEAAGGETEAEILEALHYVYPDGVMSGDPEISLGAKNQKIGSLADDMYRYLLLTHTDNEVSVSKIANSLWLDDGISREEIRQETAEALAQKYMASTFACDLQTKDAAAAMSAWVLKQTKGLLGGQSSDFSAEADTAMMLLSTVYYYDQWYDRFDPSENVTGDFYKADGTTVEAEYMRMTRNPYAVLARDGYTASSISMKGGSKITFVLPDEGMTPADILADEAMMDQLLAITEEPQAEYAEVRFQIPKYQFQSEIDLTEAVQTLGITRAFSPEEADFSGIWDDKNDPDGDRQAQDTPGQGADTLWLSGIRQQTSMSIDEKGCEAAAFTRIDYAGAAMPQDGIVELTLNRPFIIIIENDGPLFIGVINAP